MKHHAIRCWLFAIPLTLALSTPCLAETVDLMTAQPEHELLKQLSGDWTFERWALPSDDLEAQLVGSGTVKAEMVGQFFVLSRWQGQVMGMDFDAAQILGFDAENQAYSGTWADGFMSYRWQLDGSYDEEKQELILEATGPSPTGFVGTFRERHQFHGEDSITVIAEFFQEGEWNQFMKTLLERSK